MSAVGKCNGAPTMMYINIWCSSLTRHSPMSRVQFGQLSHVSTNTDMCHKPTWHINVLTKRVILHSRYMFLTCPRGEGSGGWAEQKWLPCAISRLLFNICKGDCVFSRRCRDDMPPRLLWQNHELLMRIRKTGTPNLCGNFILICGEKSRSLVKITSENVEFSCGEANFLWFHEAFLTYTCRKTLTHECICPNAHVNLNSV